MTIPRTGQRRRPSPLLPSILIALVACGSQDHIPGPTDPAKLYWALDLNYHAAALSTMAPYDTIQLVATPRNYHDEPLPGLPAPRFFSGNADRVVVSPDGLVTALGRTAAPVWVYATLTTENLKHVDSVLINVIDGSPPAVASLSIHPVPPDSAKVTARSVDLGISQPVDTIPIRVRDKDSTLLPVVFRDLEGIVPVALRSADTNTAIFLSPINAGAYGVLKGMRVGSATLYASTRAFGVEFADTLMYRVGMPVIALSSLFPDSRTKQFVVRLPVITIGAGGAVVWFPTVAYDLPGDPFMFQDIDVVFESADAPNVGPIEPVLTHLTTLTPVAFYFCLADCANGGNFFVGPSQRAVARHFPVPGIYNYHSVTGGFTGQIVVVDER